MIKTFASGETESLFNRHKSTKLPLSIQKTALRKLYMIDAATNINDLRIPPANRLEKLKGNRSEQYSIRINDQYRICFQWSQSHAYNVEITDYH
ncbi:type II toxin-antitoxin system RelE/ParE family toxin [Candidatus Peregrinibacteria bacterium]|nr:type II toxin-antitoxin system RelE/ParE family toxin [Candidatus Peregrinibacteria bacterium]